MAIRKYILGDAFLRRGLTDGFTLEGHGAASTTITLQGRRSVFFPALDSGERDCPWGRLNLNCKTVGECILTVRTYASNEDSIVQNGEIRKTTDFLLLFFCNTKMSHKEVSYLFFMRHIIKYKQDITFLKRTGIYVC